MPLHIIFDDKVDHRRKLWLVIVEHVVEYYGN